MNQRHTFSPLSVTVFALFPLYHSWWNICLSVPSPYLSVSQFHSVFLRKCWLRPNTELRRNYLKNTVFSCGASPVNNQREKDWSQTHFLRSLLAIQAFTWTGQSENVTGNNLNMHFVSSTVIEEQRAETGIDKGLKICLCFINFDKEREILVTWTVNQICNNKQTMFIYRVRLGFGLRRRPF